MAVTMRALEPPSPLPEWDGADLSDRNLLVVSRNQHAGAVLRLGRLLPLAARRARRCIALVEARLVPLFRRSFPGIDVRDAGQAEAYVDADVIASYETLIEHVGLTEDGRVVPLAPLQPDADQVAGFRNSYRDGKPLIGICWHSTNDQKDLANLENWATFLSRLDATYVSVQYGDVRADIEKLRAWSGQRIIHDDAVDSLANLDLFAAQTAALDAVVTISNTGAHMAGALNAPMFVLLDDKNHLLWPFTGRNFDWYPAATLYRKANRPWPMAFAEIEADLARRRMAKRASVWRRKTMNLVYRLRRLQSKRHREQSA
jgi:hypothetical protein